jgi:xanthine dehydrogenase accessory factor
MSALRRTAQAWRRCGKRAIVIEVVDVKGSVPREAGARMLVGAAQTAGTIGGGHLELKAIDQARAMLGALIEAGQVEAESAHYPLGPALGQCCGGAVGLRFVPLDDDALAAWPETPPRLHLQLYGAGHVGRAIVRALEPFDVRIEWIDEREDEFPPPRPDDAATTARIERVCVDAVEAEVRTAPPGAVYLVLTHRHDLDLRITAAILERGDFGFLGLIGSATKRARFEHHFERRGIPAATVARMHCPIGIEGIRGKEPEVIAASVVAQLLRSQG